MPRKITFKGEEFNLAGRTLDVNDKAPNFKAVSKNLREVSLLDYGNKIKIITTFLSLDTSVCEGQVKEFNERAIKLSGDAVVFAISKDLPFAQKRFCEKHEINNLEVLSDYKFSSFGINYGVLIKEMNLLSRSVYIIDKSNIIRYIQLVEENSTPPDYNDAFDNLEKIIKNPSKTVRHISPNTCVSCEGAEPFSTEKVISILKNYEGWELIEGNKISKKFKLKDFIEAKTFLDLISIISEEQNHHPLLTLDYNKLMVTFFTHAAKGITDNDFIMAKMVNELSY